MDNENTEEKPHFNKKADPGSRINARWYSTQKQIVNDAIARGEFENVSDGIRGIIEFYEEHRNKK